MINSVTGTLAVSPGTFDEDTQTWTASSDFACDKGAPEKVVVYYNAGYTSERRGVSDKIDLMSESFATAVAAMATARVNKAFCGCPSVTAKANYWQKNAAASTQEETWFVNFEELRNPFGTKVGEMLAWNIVGKSPSLRKVKAAIV
jgi:hypothetical protein